MDDAALRAHGGTTALEPCRSLLDACADVISHHDESGVFRFASAAALRVLGRAPAEIASRSLFDLVQPDDRPLLQHAWERALKDGTPRIVRYRVERPDGPAWVETSISLAPAGDGQASGGARMCVTRDADAQVRAEIETAERLSRAELAAEHRDALVDLIPGVVWYAPVSQDLTSYPATYMSGYLERVTGYTPAQWMETPGFWRSIIHPDDLKRTLLGMSRTLADGAPLPAYRVITKHGRIVWFQSLIRVQRSPDGTPLRLYGLTMDVTVLKETEHRHAELLDRTGHHVEERERLMAQLQVQAARVQELSTPLIPITDRLVVMPIVGTVDRERAEQILQSMLDGVARTGAEVAIVDVTGVPTLDAESAGALVRIARGLELLGSTAILTGLRADVARAMIALGVDLSGLVTRSTLQRAVAEYAGGLRPVRGGNAP
jgi:rsbT co-antagonist protein RsbR